MPLIILGLIVIIAIVIYALVMYGNSEETDTRTVRERYPHVFEKMDRMKKKGANYTVVEDDEDDEDGDDPGSAGDGHTMYFPTDAEIEKRKRNIR